MFESSQPIKEANEYDIVRGPKKNVSQRAISNSLTSYSSTCHIFYSILCTG